MSTSTNQPTRGKITHKDLVSALSVFGRYADAPDTFIIMLLNALNETDQDFTDLTIGELLAIGNDVAAIYNKQFVAGR